MVVGTLNPGAFVLTVYCDHVYVIVEYVHSVYKILSSMNCPPRGKMNKCTLPKTELDDGGDVEVIVEVKSRW